MRKKQCVAISIIISLLMLSAGITTIPGVKASYDYDNWGYASNLYTTNWLQYSGEAQSTATAFSNIENLFSQKTFYYYGYPYGPSYGELLNWGSSETPNDVYNRIDHDNYYHYYFYTVLYVGHGGPYGFYGHTDYPDDPYTTPSLISFNTIQSHTQSNPGHRFVFMWVCMGGDNSPQGSPSAWNPLYWSDPPTYTPYTWVGFDNASPWLIDQMSAGNIFQYWLVFFYYYALSGSYSVMDALNLASQATGFQDFGSSILGGSGRYWTYWPYPPSGPLWATGQMHVAGNPFNTYLPKDVYYP
jgi:hypothetical protein